jgi:uridine kinase
MDINGITSEIEKAKSDKPILIAIEGFGGSGKSTLAEKLKNGLPNSEVIKIDSFIIKENAQNAQPWEEVFDKKRLEEQVLKPASQDLPVTYQKFDWVNNRLGADVMLSHFKYLIVDGITSYIPELEHYYNFKIWVNTPIDIAKSRGKNQDADNENAGLWDKWAKCDLVYQEKYHPEKRADFVIDNSKEN